MSRTVFFFLNLVCMVCLSGCISKPADPGPPAVGPDVICRGENENVKKACGCDPVSKRMFQAFDNSDMTKDVKEESQNCISGNVNVSALDKNLIDSQMKACVARTHKLNPKYQDEISKIVGKAMQVPEREIKIWQDCYEKQIGGGQKLKLNQTQLKFNIFHAEDKITLMNIFNAPVTWQITSPEGYRFSPSKGTLPPESPPVSVDVYRIKAPAKKRSVALFQTDEKEAYKLELVVTDNSTTAKLEPIFKSKSRSQPKKEPTAVAYAVVQSEAPRNTSESERWMAAGQLLNSSGKFHDGVIAYQKAVEADPNSNIAAYEVAKAHYKASDKRRALVSLKKIVQLPDSGFQFLALGGVLAILAKDQLEKCDVQHQTSCPKISHELLQEASEQLNGKDLLEFQKQIPSFFGEFESTYGQGSAQSVSDLVSAVATKLK